MKVALLTTDTLHHAYFVRALDAFFPLSAIFLEKKGFPAPFETAHPFEKERDELEREEWFQGNSVSLFDDQRSSASDTINDRKILEELETLSPEVIIVFGTRKIKPAFMRITPGKILNLHGGDPEEYRGLDTHLWAIYHGDFAGLQTTLHHLEEELDTGAIVQRQSLALKRGMKITELRKVNTELCVEMVREALTDYKAHGVFPSIAQKKTGRYYSFMPTCMKELCVQKFEKHTAYL